VKNGEYHFGLGFRTRSHKCVQQQRQKITGRLKSSGWFFLIGASPQPLHQGDAHGHSFIAKCRVSRSIKVAVGECEGDIHEVPSGTHISII
jgi:hypothetical protein